MTQEKTAFIVLAEVARCISAPLKAMFHTIQEIAERMRVTQKTVRGWIIDGRLGAIKFGRVYRIRDCQFSDFLDRQTVEATREKTT